MNQRPTHEDLAGRRSVVPTLAIAGTHATVAIFLAAELNVWIDECYTLDTVSGSIGYAWSQSITFESQPPGYFLLLNLWLRLIDTVFFARILSVVCTTLTILACHSISRLYFRAEVPPYLLPFLVAAHPLTLFAAVEMRRYALALLVTGLLVLVFKRAFPASREAVLGWKCTYLVLATTSLYVEYLCVLLLVANGVVLGMQRRWRDLTTYAALVFVAAILFIPLFHAAIYHVGVYEAIEASSASQAFKTMKFVSYSLDNLVMTLWMHPWNRPAKVVLLAGAAYLLLRTLTRRSADPKRSLIMEPLVLTMSLVAGLVLVSFAAAPALLQPKHLIVTLIPWAMVAAGFWALCSRVAYVTALSGVVLVNLVANVAEFRHVAKRGDSIRVVQYIQENERTNEPILAFYPEVALGVRHHYSGENRIIAVPKKVNFSSYDLSQYVLPEDDAYWSSLRSDLSDSENVWVVTDPFSDVEIGGCGYGELNFNCELFEDWLNAEFALVRDSRFFEARVRYFRRLQP